MVYLVPWNMHESGNIFVLLTMLLRLMPWKMKLEREILCLEDENGRVMRRPCLQRASCILSSQCIFSVDGRFVYWLEQKTTLGCIPQKLSHICTTCWQLCHSVVVTLSKTLNFQEPWLPEVPQKSQELKTTTFTTITSNLGRIRKRPCQYWENSFLCFV